MKRRAPARGRRFGRRFGRLFARLRNAAPLLAALLSLGHAQAQPTPEPVPPHPTATPTPEASSPLSPEAQAAWEEAQQALQRQDWVQAELLLERTLMLSPEHAESLVQLALVLLHRGRIETAQALIAALEADPRTPPAQRARLAQLRTAAASPLPAASDAPAHTTVQLGLGRSSNPLAVTSAREIRLTLPGGDLVAALNQRPEPASLVTAEVSHQAANGTEWAAQLRRSSLAGTPTAWRLGALIPLAPGAPAPAGSPWALQLGAQYGLDGSGRSSLQLAHRCGLGANGGSAWLCGVGVFEENTGRRGWLARAVVARSDALPTASAQSVAALGWVEAEIVRHSAQPDLLRLGAQLSWQPAPAWQATAALQWQGDASGYSPLLAEGAPRRLLTAQVAVQWHLPLATAGGRWTLQLATAQRRANLPLFAWREHNAQLLWQRMLRH